MDSIDLDKEFQKVERDIAAGIAQNQDVTDLLRRKIKLINQGYNLFSKKIIESKQKMIAPLYAKKLSFLNNIKAIQNQLNDDTTSVDAEINKVHTAMRQDGLGWILDNLPDKKD